MPRAEPSVPGSAFKDRSIRLVVCGVVSVIVGGLCALLGLLHVVLLLVAGRVPGTETLAVAPRSYVMGALLYVLLGAAFIWVGSGSIRKRRWARPIMLSLGWVWLLSGLTVLLFLPSLLDATLSAVQATTAEVVVFVKLVVLGGGVLVGVVLPAAFIWVYQDRDLARTCEARDPDPAWTERCPATVLGLSVGLGACAVLLLPLALRPVVPVFGRLVTGLPGTFLVLLGSAACLYLARETFALRMTGWWGSTGLLLLVGLSTLVTLHEVDPVEFYREMGYPEPQLALLRQSAAFGRGLSSWLTAVLTLLSVVYMAVIRKHFQPAGAHRVE